ncbi:MAG: cycL, partial [Chloroflexi bacterium]|nr:cycL [Chloroflexota bacterium]
RSCAFSAAFALVLVAPSVWADSMDDQALAIARELQCPICQGLSVADSPSQLAVQMRGVIRDKLQAGESRDAIMEYFAERYGESVLMSPPRAGFTAFVWIAPYVAVAVAVAVVAWVIMRRTGPMPAAIPDSRPDGYLDEVDDAFRELRDRPLR